MKNKKEKNTEIKTDTPAERVNETPEQEEKKSKSGKILNIVIFSLLGIVILLFAAACFLDNRHVRFYITDELEINQELGEEFTDPGREAVTVGKIFGESHRKLKLNTEGSVDTEKLGSYKLKYTANYLFNDYSVTRTVNVVDTTPPEISLKYIEGYEPNWFTGYEEEGYEAYDRADGDLTDKVESQILDDKIIYTVSDSRGNTATVERPSNFSDTAPKIQLLGEAESEFTASPFYKEPGFTATDKLGNDYSDMVQIEGVVLPYKAGDYEVKYFIENPLGNRVEAVRKVKVLPAELPDSISPEEKTIYLTFDDGPGPYTDWLLDVLGKYDVKATFFVTCLNPDYQDCIGRAAREGHSVAAHTASHNYRHVYAGEEAYFADLEKVQELIYQQTGAYTSLVRFPGGSSNTVSNFNPGIMTRLAAALTDSGYKYFDWNVSSGDAGETTDTDVVVENVINGCSGKKASVVLQHDIKDYSVAAVERIIKWGLRNGYTFRALDITSPTAHHGIAN